jgi:hypothetical protein
MAVFIQEAETQLPLTQDGVYVDKDQNIIAAKAARPFSIFTTKINECKPLEQEHLTSEHNVLSS